MALEHSHTVHQEPANTGIDILTIDNAHAVARLSLFGGHLLSFTPKADGRERLWLSDKALLDGSKAIRGGIPICWPWFGPHPSLGKQPAHGYARTQNWQLLSIDESPENTVLKLAPETTLNNGFNGKAKLELEVEVGKALSVTLTTTNIGDTPLEYGGALHSYLTVGDISDCDIQGLSGNYRDKLDNGKLKTTPVPYTFTDETDRVHLDPPGYLTLHHGLHSTYLEQAGHDSIVVWNPWQNKSKQMNDVADEAYRNFVCIEAAITQGKTLAAQQQHRLHQKIS